jgi:hypothetical protein
VLRTAHVQRSAVRGQVRELLQRLRRHPSMQQRQLRRRPSLQSPDELVLHAEDVRGGLSRPVWQPRRRLRQSHRPVVQQLRGNAGMQHGQ